MRALIEVAKGRSIFCTKASEEDSCVPFVLLRADAESKSVSIGS